MMKVAVGSKNPVKINAVKLAFEKVWPEETWEVVGEEVGSDVSDQPMSLEETLTGAKNRARKALVKLGGDYGVGLEGGIFALGDRYFDGGWIVIRNLAGEEGIGSTVHAMLSDKMIAMIKSGKELGEVDDIMFNQVNSKQDLGHFGLITKGIIPRTEAYRDAVIFALARFIHPHLFEK